MLKMKTAVRSLLGYLQNSDVTYVECIYSICPKIITLQKCGWYSSNVRISKYTFSTTSKELETSTHNS